MFRCFFISFFEMSTLSMPLTPVISSIRSSTMVTFLSSPKNPSKKTLPFSLSRKDILLTLCSEFISIENACWSIFFVIFLRLDII